MNPQDESLPTPDAATPAESPSRMSSDQRPEPKTRWPLLLAVVLLAAGIGGGVLYATYRVETVRLASHGMKVRANGTKAAATPAKPGPRQVSTAPDPAEIRTPIRIVRLGKGQDARAVVELGHPDGGRGNDVKMTRQGILDREIIRQALLMAARDELGLETRDELLDDVAPGPGEGSPLALVVLFRTGECHALIRQATGNKVEILQKHDLGTDADSGDYFALIAPTAERLARTDFLELLKQQRLKGQSNKVLDTAPVPPEVEHRLDQLGFVDHVVALRSLHAAMRSDGESPERLAALVRAYGQLGLLTEYQWHSAHRIFKARAVLYAERLVARYPDWPDALRVRAFARAVVGHHRLALGDLARAKDLAEKPGPAKPEDPSVARPAPLNLTWLPVLEAFLDGDRARLTSRDGPHRKLAALFNMLWLEFPYRTRILVQAARDLAGADADCCYAYDTICHAGQLGDMHVATVMGPDTFSKLFPLKLRSIKDLPGPVRQLLEKGRDEISLVEALDRAGRPGEDPVEPSWGVLAHLAREARFVHACRRLEFMTGPWSVPAGEYFDDIQPFVAHHRYFPYLQFLALAPQEGIPAFRAMADRLDFSEADPNEVSMIRALINLNHPAGNDAYVLAFFHGSAHYRDIGQRLENSTNLRAHFGHVLHTICPNSAYARAILVEFDWDQTKDEVPGWLEKFGDAPSFIGALGKKYIELKKYDEAEKLLRRYMELSPDRWAYQKLAACYLARNNRAQWKKTLDDFLTNTEPAGLEHAQVQVELARYLMAAGKWTEARPYAEAAAETWAAWAMACAADCSEGLHDWDRAELWLRRKSERYLGSSWPDWYLFCLRTGHGNVEMARAFVESYLSAVAERPDLLNPGPAGFFAWSSGEIKPALNLLDTAYQREPGIVYGIARILLADELGDKARRDGLIGEFCTRFRNYRRMVTLCEMIRDAPIADKKVKLDLQAVETVLQKMPARTRGDAEFLVGRFLLNHGQPLMAQKLLQRCGEAPEPYIWVKAMAADSARTILKREAL